MGKLGAMNSVEMDTQANVKFLAKPYPGRIVIVSLSDDGNSWRLFTGMGGRSEPSKNRYYQKFSDMNGHGEFIRTEPHDIELHGKLLGDPTVRIDPAAILYTAHRQKLVHGNTWHVAGNGEQTDGLSVTMSMSGLSGIDRFMQGQCLYKNEGKKNDYTARITVALNVENGSAFLGKVERDPNNFEESVYLLEYLSEQRAKKGESGLWITPGEGYLMATYDGEGGTEPDTVMIRRLYLPGSLEDNMNLVWQTWSSKRNENQVDTRAGLAGKEIEKGSGRFTYSIRSVFRNPGHPEDDQKAT